MELKEGTRVYSTDGEEIGQLNRFVIDPRTNQLTHIVVQKGLLLPEDKVIPIDWVASAQEDRVMLTGSSGKVEDLPPFEEVHYVRLDDEDQQKMAYAPYAYSPRYYWYPTFGFPGYAHPYYSANVAQETERNIPGNTVPLKEGARVFGKDGDHIGDVERVLADPTNNQVTHFVISQGFLLKERKLVPVSWVNSVSENEVHLVVASKLVDRLPEYQT